MHAALELVDRENIDRIVCLGDLVGYNADPDACIDVAVQREMLCILGNHDSVAAGLSEPDDFAPAARHAIRWTRRNLSRRGRDFLCKLPLSRVIDGEFLAVHGSLHPRPNPDQRIETEAIAAMTFDALERHFDGLSVVFFGHTHVPVIYERFGPVISRLPPANVSLQAGRQYLINPGSVGRPRDGDRRASFAIFDTADRRIEFLRAEYDESLTRRKAHLAGALYDPRPLARCFHWVQRRLSSAAMETVAKDH